MNANKACSITGCKRESKANNLCAFHYARSRTGIPCDMNAYKRGMLCAAHHGKKAGAELRAKLCAVHRGKKASAELRAKRAELRAKRAALHAA